MIHASQPRSILAQRAFSPATTRSSTHRSRAIAVLWQRGFEKLQQGTLDPMQLAKDVQAAVEPSLELKQSRGDVLLDMWTSLNRIDP